MDRETRILCLLTAVIECISDKGSWVFAQDSGIIFVRLIGRRRDSTAVDHVVVVDDAKKVVWDRAEEYGIKLRSGVFFLCVGEDASLLSFQEVKYLEKKPGRDGGKWYKNSQRMSDEKSQSMIQEAHEAKIVWSVAIGRNDLYSFSIQVVRYLLVWVP